MYGPFKPAVSQTVTHHECKNLIQRVQKYVYLPRETDTQKVACPWWYRNRSFCVDLVEASRYSIRIEGGGSAFTKKVHKGKCSDFALPLHLRVLNIDQVDYSNSRAPLQVMLPRSGKRRIRFDDKVEQCIAGECTYKANEEDAEREVVDSSQSEDDGIPRMKPAKRPKLPNITSRNGSSSGRADSYLGLKTIEN